MFENLIMIVFVLGYGAMAMEHVIGINKASSAMITAVICWVLLAEEHLHLTGGNIHGVVDSLSHHLESTAQIVFFLIAPENKKKDRKSTPLNSSHITRSSMPSSA